MNKKSLLKVENLNKSFSGLHVLKDVSFEINAGQIVGLLGPNGAGKTTTIKIITGLLKADSGRVSLFSEKIASSIPPKTKAKIGVVFEENNLYSRLSAADNLKLFAGINNIKSDRIDHLLKEYQLYDVKEKKVKNFSKGMKKRLMICRSLIAEPELLIFDEATGGLDPISAEIIRNKLIEYREEGKAVLISTHYLEEADRLCDKIVFMSAGKIKAFDTTASFKDKLSDKYLRLQFLLEKDKINLDKTKNYLNDFLSIEESLKISENKIVLKLLLKEDTFKRAALLSKKYKLLDFSKDEADLQGVFRKLNL